MHYSFPPFNINDSLEGSTPQRFFKDHFSYISEQSLKLLTNRSEDEIRICALDVNRIRLNKGLEASAILFKNKTTGYIFDVDCKDRIKFNEPTPATMLIEGLNKFHVSNSISFPNARYYEYLAVFCLLLTGLAIDIEDQLINTASKKEKEPLLNAIAELVLDSLESLSLASKFKINPPKEELKNKSNKPISIRNKKAADIRHMGRKQLDKKFRKVYYSNPPAKKIDAIRSFIKSLSKEELELLHPDSEKERERFFYRVLKNSPKGILF
jgi:hypothetical protein